MRRGWTLAHHQKGCLELYQGKETGRTETASGTAHLFSKCSLSWAVSALSQRKLKYFGNLGGIRLDRLVEQGRDLPSAPDGPSST